MKREDSDKKLVFSELVPSYDLGALKTMALKPSSHKGKGVVLSEETRQHGHGMEQMLELGSEDKAIKILVDAHNHFHLADFPSLAFDGYEHESRDLEFFTNHLEYGHQKFLFNIDNTIALVNESDYVLGTDEDQKRVLFVSKGDPNQFVFENAREILGLEERYAEMDKKRAE